MKETADSIYDLLQKAGLQVIFDDRNERPGVKFKDMDLMGIPVRIVVGDKNLPNVEIKIRSTGEVKLMSVQDAVKFSVDFVKEETDKLNA